MPSVVISTRVVSVGKMHDKLQSRQTNPPATVLSSIQTLPSATDYVISFQPDAWMMRTQHILHSLANFPIYSATFISNDILALGGGGGSGRTGVKNRIRLYRIQTTLDIEELDEYQLLQEDVPMSMTSHQKRREIVCGINALYDGNTNDITNPENCRVFTVKDSKIKPLKTRSTFTTKNPEYYQNVTVFSPGHDFLAVGSTTNEITILSYPELKPLSDCLRSAEGQLYDVAITSNSLIVVNSKCLDIYSASTTKSKLSTFPKKPLKTILATATAIPDLTFRAARFDPVQSQYLYTVMNATPSRSGRKVSSRYSYLLKWDTEKWQVVKTRKIVDKAVTCFDMSPDGKLVAVGCADYSIRLFDTHTLTPFLTILKAHEFPPTVLRFNMSGSLLASASVDNAVRVIAIPEKMDTAMSKKLLALVVALLVLLLGILFSSQRH